MGLMIIETDDYMSLREAAEEIGVNPSTLSVSILRGSLEAIKPWGSYLVLRTSAAEYKARTQPNGVPCAGRPRKKIS